MLSILHEVKDVHTHTHTHTHTHMHACTYTCMPEAHICLVDPCKVQVCMHIADLAVTHRCCLELLELASKFWLIDLL